MPCHSSNSDVEDLEALEDTLEVLSDADAMADIREAAAARRSPQTIELTKEEARGPLVPWMSTGCDGLHLRFSISIVSRHPHHEWWGRSSSSASAA